MKEKSIYLIILVAILFSSCGKENVRKAKAILFQEKDEIRVVVLFDNSLSYKQYISPTLVQVRELFKHLAHDYPQCSTSLLLIDQKATIWSGKNQSLQRAYDELKNLLQKETSRYTNLIDAVERGLYLLKKEEAEKYYLLIFSDLKHSTPSYFPQDKDLVPPPTNFPWEEIKKADANVFAFYVPFKEWKVWENVSRLMGVNIKGFLPEELKSVMVKDIVFGGE
jgi:hypothetical protein